MKRLVALLLLICLTVVSTVGFIGCDEVVISNPTKLTTPVVTLNGNVATWNPDPYADKFEISLDGKLSYVENTYTSQTLTEGVTFRVRAVGDGKKFATSDWSNVVIYTVSTEMPTEAPTEAPTKAPTEAPTEEPTEAPTEKPTTEIPTEEPTDEPTTETSTEVPTDEPTSEIPTEEPTEAPTEEVTTEVPAEEVTTAAPTEAPTEEITTEEITTEEITTEEYPVPPAEKPTEQPTEEPTEQPTDAPADIPVVETAYKLTMNQLGIGKVLYFNGATESANVTYRLATTENVAEAVDVYLEAVDGVQGGYRLYFMNGTTKTYIRVFERIAGQPGSGSGSLELVTNTPAEYFTYDSNARTLLYTNVDGTNSYYIGTYGSYSTFSVSNTSYITGDKAQNVDVTQFPSRFVEWKDGTEETTTVPTEETTEENTENDVPVISISSLNSNFDSYTTSGETVQVTGVVYAGDSYGLHIVDDNQNTLYVKFDYSDLSLSLGQKITFTGYANLYYSLPQLVATSAVVGDVVGHNLILYTGTVDQIINANASQSSKVFKHNIYRVTGVVTEENGNYYLVDGNYKLQFKLSPFTDIIMSYVGKKISVNVVLHDYFITTDIFRIIPLPGEDADIKEYDENGVPIVSIPDLNRNFDSYVSSGETVQVTGVVYGGDDYGLYIIDGNQNSLYVKFNYSNTQITIGQQITFTGSANLYYSLPQLVATSAIIDKVVDYDLTLNVGTIEQIINANASQSSKVFAHNVYRATGEVVQDGNNYYLVDGNYKLQFKASSYTDVILSYIGKKISVNVVLHDCFTTTGIFRVIPLPGDDANIEEIGGTTPGEKVTDINFVMINDTHGAFTDSNDGYSIGRVDSLVDALEATKGEYIFIHNGDAFQGSYVSGETYGLALIEALNASNLDCFVIGNHEFDWGIDKIANYADGDPTNGEANFPFLGANIYYKGTTTRPDWIDAYTIIEQDGIKVGIIGIIGEDHESSILTRNVKDYDFVNPINIIKTTAEYLRNTEGCGVVVVATHDYDTAMNNSIAQLSGGSRIDAIFCAHTHQNINETVTRSDSVVIPVVQCNHKNQNAQELIISIGENDEYVSYTAQKYYPQNYSISSDVQVVIAKYQDMIDESNEVIGTTSVSLSKQTLGAYSVDAMLNYEYSEYNFGDIDIAIINTGGMRATINSGEITRAEVFEVCPFNNIVVLINMRGSLIKDLCRRNSSYFYIDTDSAIGSYTALDDNTIYQLAVIDYVFENTYYTQFSNLKESDYIVTEYLLRDLLMAYIDKAY